MRKLVADTAQMLRGKCLIEANCCLSFIISCLSWFSEYHTGLRVLCTTGISHTNLQCANLHCIQSAIILIIITPAGLFA